MAAVLVAILFSATFIWWWADASELIRAWMAQRVVEATPHVNTPTPTMPADLVAYAEESADSWAKNDAYKVLHELYETTGSWDNVRQILAVRNGA